MTKIFDKVKFFDKVKILPGGISNTPTYSLQRSVSPVQGGGSSITFTVNTTNVENGTSLPYTISGISPADVTSGSLTGSFTVASNTASTTLGVSLEPTSPGVNSAALALNNGAASISVFPAPTYSLSRSAASVNEGSSITFTLTTTGVANGTSVPYSISGISAGDLSSGSLTGNFVVNNGSATVSVTLANDALTEGTETISITAQGASTSASVNDTSLNPPPSPTYTLSRSAASINEGSSVTFTLTTTNVANGTSIPYSITGISAEDLSSGSLSGNFVINNGSATVTLTAASDALTEGTETITITAASQSTSTSIADNSFNPVTGPAETVLLLAGDGTNNANNNTFLDSSSNSFAITRNGSVIQGSFSPFPLNGATYNPSVHGGSAYFNGGSYLTTPTDSALAVGTSNFTLEAWVYATGTSGYKSIFSTRPGQISTSDAFTIGLDNNNTTVYWYSTGYAFISQPIGLNTWTHIAVCRSGSTINLFINGELVATASKNENLNVASVGIGANTNGSELFIGYMSSLRLVKGTALYTSNFARPTAPLTTTSNGGGGGTAPTSSQVSLLLNFTNGGIIDSAAKNNLITVGNAAISTSVKKYGTGSIYFDGAGDYLTIPSATISDFGLSPFTFECWVYKEGTGFDGAIYDGRPTSGNGPYFAITTFSDNRIMITVDNSFVFTSTATFASNQWNHIAVCRTSTGTNGCTVYLNGSSIGSFTCSTDFLNGFNVIGAISYTPLGNAPWRGYIDDLRITKNLARYTSNFTPPTGPLTINI